MDAQESVAAPGQHYSGSNRIPNIKQFMERLDKDKKGRDAKIDSEVTGGAKTSSSASEATAHQEGQRRRGTNRRTVRDPVTGKDVEIDDNDGSLLKEAEDPHVRPPPHSSHS